MSRIFIKWIPIRHYFLVLTFLFSFLDVIAQPPCATNPVAGDFCSTATPICNLNGYCGNTSATYTYWVSPTNHANETNTPLGNVFCASIQNNSWLKFIADSTIAIFDVWVSNCHINQGIQMQIYSTTDCYNFISVSNCWNPGSPTNGQITATNLTPGQVYFFMIDGRNGDVCDYVIAAHIGVGSTPTLTADQSICPGDSANLTATGGSTYLWSSTPSDPSLSSQTTSPTIHVHPLVNTTYSVIITKAGSNSFCPNNVTTLTSTVSINPLPAFTLSSTSDHCNLADGTAIAHITSTSGQFSFQWNTLPTPQTNDTATNLASGNYILTVTDTTGCLSLDSVTVLLDTILFPQIIGPPILCSGTTAILSTSTNYSTYLWSTNATTPTITVSQGGLYTLLVHSNGCSGSDSLLLTGINVPLPIINGPIYICQGDTQTLTLNNPYNSQLWSTNATTPTITINTGGTYSVTVYDTNQCSANTSITIIQKYGPTLHLFSTSDICDHLNGTATVVAQNGIGNYSYSWSNGQTTDSIGGLASGAYNVTVTDSLCITTASINVNEIPGPTANFFYNPTTPSYDFQPVKVIFYDLSIGNIITWLWYPGDDGNNNNTSEFSHYYNNSGTYLVTLIVTDTNGCIDSISKNLIVVDEFDLFVPNAFTPNSDGTNDGFSAQGVGVNPDKFELTIFDRWGETVFHTHIWQGTRSEPWNGTFKNTGNDAFEGVYIYSILVSDLVGKAHQFYGKVVLLH